MLKFLFLSLFANAVTSLLNSKVTSRVNLTQRRISFVESGDLSCIADDDDDPYGDLLNLRKPVEVDEAQEMLNVLSIDSKIDSSSSVKTRMTPKTAQEQWEHWDAFMEQEFGNMDAEITEDQKWMIDMRDMVEQKRGMSAHFPYIPTVNPYNLT